MPRCCQPDPREFEPSYASVLVAGKSEDLRRAVEGLELDSPICPCVTAWCNRCQRVSTVVSSRHLFPCPSAHFAHALMLRARVEYSLLVWEQRGGRSEETSRK